MNNLILYISGDYMESLFKVTGKEILKIDTTILHTSTYNYNEDVIEFINKNAEVILKSNKEEVNDIPLKILDKYNSLYLIDKKEITYTDEIKINILSSLSSEKDIIVFYDILNYIDNKTKNKIIKELKEKGKLIINYTTEIEETLLLDYVIVIHNNNIIMEGKTELILKEEKIIKKIGFNIPQIIELSNGLKYYNVINKTYFDIESLIEDLWK